jgi:outer membrane receptor protein involved in Fe transport
LVVSLAAAGFTAAAVAADVKDSSESLDEVVVTGTHLVKNGDELPTPVTVLSTQELLATTPSTIPDGLNKLPTLALSRNSANLNNPSDSFTGNYLNLRGLGIQRNLVLLDGHRVPPTSYTGAVDVNTLPELMVERVEIVTGGASAVYGSDAVSGVINYVLDKKFEGFKGTAQYGLSSHNDAKSYRAGFAFGHELAGGRGHFEASYEHFKQDPLSDKAQRVNGALSINVVGSGTQADPYRLINNTRNGAFGFNGSVLFPGAASGQQFIAPGILGAFTHGTNEGGPESGGDGFYGKGSAITASQKTDQLFTRFDYDATDNVKLYVQGNYGQSLNENNFYPVLLFSRNGGPFNGAPIVFIDSTNPYLPAATQAQFGGAPSFAFGRAFSDLQWGVSSQTTAWSGAAGLTAKIDRFNLGVQYSHSQTTVYNNFKNDPINGRLYAALDAVVNPANGQIVCAAALTNPNYHDCIPFNPFGTTVASQASSLDWIKGSNYNRPQFKLDDLDASFAGVIFDNWAGPVQGAVSVDFRRQSMDVTTPFPVGMIADCNGISTLNCQQGVTPYISNQIPPVSASQTVSEGALEADIPLLKGSAFAKSLNLNLAARYTRYSTSGSVETWKAGLDWQVTDSLRFRTTRSRDIRAPSLFDLYQPVTTSGSGYTDLHTGFVGIATTQFGGNPNLTPEKADTFTAGLVFHPVGLPGFGLAVDYYNIKVTDAISNIDGRFLNIQKICEDSNGTSHFCSLYERPLPFSDHTLANKPSVVKFQQLNASEMNLWGVDVEANYRFQAAGGHVTLRGLVGYQPHYDVVIAPGIPALQLAGSASTQANGGVPKLRFTMMADYNVGDFTVSAQERWRRSLKWDNDPTVVYAIPDVPSVAYTDLTFSLKFGESSRYDAFLSIQNLFDKQPPIYIQPGSAGVPNFSFPATTGDDVIGRYMTAGIRFKL